MVWDLNVLLNNNHSSPESDKKKEENKRKAIIQLRFSSVAILLIKLPSSVIKSHKNLH